jgi:hypothetical protein
MNLHAEAHEPEPRGLWARVRASVHLPGTLIRLVRRDPHHVPERLTIYAVEHQADEARAWAERVRERGGEGSLTAVADEQRRRTISTGRIDGAISGTPFFIALVPAYVAFLRQEVRFHLRMAALYGRDPADPHVAADFLVLRGVRKHIDEALTELETVRAAPLPPAGVRTPLRSWYRAIVQVLVLAGFLSPPDDDDGKRPTLWTRLVYVVQLVVAGLIWALTWIVPVTFMIMMSWACESDARRFSQRVLTHYQDGHADLDATIASADRKAGGNRAITVGRGALVVLSVAIPLAVVASTLLKHNGPLGINLPESFAALIALAIVIGVSAVALRG